jgi:hypothetical protein
VKEVRTGEAADIANVSEGTIRKRLVPVRVEQVRSPGRGTRYVHYYALEDAEALRDKKMRPAIVLVGVAYEMAIERIAETLVTKAHLKPADLELNSAKLLVKVKAQVKNVLLDREQQFAADAACDFADQLRRRRNDAAHTAPTYGFEDREEAEEFVVSAGRHMPHLWRMH